MNILTDALPDYVCIDGMRYKIHTAFQNWILFELEMQDSSADFHTKAAKLLRLCYKELPPSAKKAFYAMAEFYAGKNASKKEGEGESARGLPLYHFAIDADLIYAAFLAQYGMDLQSTPLHWWQFKALFSALNDTNRIVKIMEYRSMDLSRVKDSEQKKFYRKMKKLYALPDPRTAKQKESDMIKSLEGLF